MSTEPTYPPDQEVIQGLCELLLKCNAAQPPTDPTHVTLTLRSILQHQYPNGVAASSGPKTAQVPLPVLGCCRFGSHAISNILEADCHPPGVWTAGAC